MISMALLALTAVYDMALDTWDAAQGVVYNRKETWRLRG